MPCLNNSALAFSLSIVTELVLEDGWLMIPGTGKLEDEEVAEPILG